MPQDNARCLHDQAEALVLALLDRMRAMHAAKPLTWEVHPDALRLRRIYAKAERRSARRLYKYLTMPA